MTDLPNYDDRRREAERLSKLARTPAERDDFLKIAEIWRRLAEEPPTGAKVQAQRRRQERLPKAQDEDPPA